MHTLLLIVHLCPKHQSTGEVIGLMKAAPSGLAFRDRVTD